MSYANDKEIIELVERFESSAISAKEWNHAAHLTVALFYAVNHDFETA